MAVYKPVRHPKNIICTSEASVHIIFFGWRTGPYTAIWPSVSWNIWYMLPWKFIMWRHCLSYYPFSFDHCIFCHLITLWYLQTYFIIKVVMLSIFRGVLQLFPRNVLNVLWVVRPYINMLRFPTSNYEK